MAYMRVVLIYVTYGKRLMGFFLESHYLPTADVSYFRRPLTVEEKTKQTQPVVNIVILVHGHNEKEKVGFEEKETPDV
jgi:hypothetical protein